MSFDALGLLPELVHAVTSRGYREPTAIQQRAIPAILKGRDLIGTAQTGTGKTASFTLPLLHILSSSRSKTALAGGAVRALILTPTRELTAQVAASIELDSRGLSLKSAAIFGGVNITPQIAKLRRGVDILVATPGRLLDHITQGTVSLSGVTMLVLDEADRMLDMGFINDIRRVLALLPQNRQTLLFSATFSKEIRALADSLLKDPVLVETAPRNTAAKAIQQFIYPVDRHRKGDLLSHLIHSRGWQQVLVFTRTKHVANRLAEKLEKDGISATAIHSNKSQAARTRALVNFKNKTLRVLVATDIAARGLDIDQLPHVVNFELPNVPEDYVHRIGRTGRAGNEGEAISLVCIDEHKFLYDIERLLGSKFLREEIAGYEPDPTIKPEPILLGRQAGGNRTHQAISKPTSRKQEDQKEKQQLPPANFSKPPRNQQSKGTSAPAQPLPSAKPQRPSSGPTHGPASKSKSPETNSSQPSSPLQRKGSRSGIHSAAPRGSSPRKPWRGSSQRRSSGR